MPNFKTSSRRFLLCGSIFAAAVSSHAANAQQAETVASAGMNDDVIIVTGSIRQAQEAAVETKRAALNFVDVASADSVGRFPDENTAAALARLPGVAVQRDQGQARYIQVRGAPNRWTSVSIDGIPQTGVDESGDSRSYRFDAVPAVLLSQLVVNKSLTPAITAEAITANVDLKTFSPLATSGFSVNGDIGYGLMELGKGQQRQGSLRLSWSNGDFGIALGASHYLRDQVTDNREADYDDFGPTNIDFRSYKLERSNNGLFGVIEGRASDDLKLYARGVFTEFRDKEDRNAYQFELNQAASGTRGELSGNLVSVPVTATYDDGRYINQNYIGTAGFEYDNVAGWGVDGAVSFTRTDNTTALLLVQGATRGVNSPSINYDRTADPLFPVVSLFQTVNVGEGVLARGNALGSFNQTVFDVARSRMIPIVQATRSDAWTGKLDGWNQLGNVKLMAGVLASFRKIEGNNFGIAGVVPLGPLGFNLNDYATNEPWETEFPLGFTPNYIDNRRLQGDLLNTLAGAGINVEDFILPTSLYDQNERIFATYAQGEFDFNQLVVTAGARLESYRIQNEGTALIGRVPTPLRASRSFTDIFPSVNARYEVDDNLVLRLSGQRGTSRPAYAAIRVGASISDTDRTISGGNPQLLPEYTWGLDSSLEYYFSSNGVASVAGFYRWVDNVLYQSRQRVGSALYDTEGFDRSDYFLSSTFNGTNGGLYGVEFNIENQFDFLPGALAGFGVQANLTLLGGAFDAPQVDGSVIREQFQGLSDTVLNASLFYEYAGLSARVSYQWRSDYLDTIGGLGAGEFRAATENLDVTLRYALTENFTLFADFANLTNEKYVAFEDTIATPSEVEQIGRRYLAGIRFNF